jgi:hypothetical protein
MAGRRKILYILMLVFILLVVLLELGSLGLLKSAAPAPGALAALLPTPEPTPSPQDQALHSALQDSQGDLNQMLNQDKPPGRAIPAMAMLDGILLLVTILWAVQVFLGNNVYSAVAATATCIVNLLLIIAGIIAIFLAIAFLLLMVGLLLAVPFGTLAYLALFGFFNRGGAAAALGILLALKVGYIICFGIAQKDLRVAMILLALTSLLANVIIGFLHGFLPSFLTSITDDVAAIIVLILAVIWALYYCITSIIPTLRVVGSLLKLGR